MLAAIFIRIIFSWTGFDPSNPIYSVIHEITEPILQPIRNFLPRMGMFDLSPMIASFLLFILLQVGLQLQAA
jgi:YggT family protein